MLGLQEELPFDQFKRYHALRLTQNPFHIFSEFLLPFWLAFAGLRENEIYFLPPQSLQTLRSTH